MSSTTPGVPLFDSQRQFQALADELLPALARVAASGRYILGSECETLERRLAEYCGAAHAVVCASGSDALLLALLAACGTPSPSSVPEPPKLPPGPASLSKPLPEPGTFSKRARANMQRWQQMLTEPLTD